MARFGDGDRELFLRHFGVAVVYGAYAEDPGGILDEETDPVLEGHTVGQLAGLRSVRVKSGAFAPEIGGAITVDGIPYIVRDIRALPPDSAWTRLFLEDAE